MDLSWEVAWSAPADSFLEPVAILPEAGGRVRLLLASGSLRDWRQPRRPRFLSMALVELQETTDGWQRLPPWPGRNRHPDFVAPTALVESDGMSHFLWSSAPAATTEVDTPSSNDPAGGGSGVAELELWYALFRDGSWQPPQQILPAVEGWALTDGRSRAPPVRLNGTHLFTLSALPGGRIKGVVIATAQEMGDSVTTVPEDQLIGWGEYSSVVVDGKGNLSVAIIGGNPSGSVRVTQSRDEGRTWGEPRTIYSPPLPGRLFSSLETAFGSVGNWHLFWPEVTSNGSVLIWMREIGADWVQDTVPSLDDVASSSLIRAACGSLDLFAVNNGVPGTVRPPGTRYHGILHHLRIEDSAPAVPRPIPIQGISIHRAPVGGILPSGEYALMMTGQRIADDANLVLVARNRSRRR